MKTISNLYGCIVDIHIFIIQLLLYIYLKHLLYPTKLQNEKKL